MSEPQRALGDVKATDPSGEHPELTHLLKTYFDVCNTALERADADDDRKQLFHWLQQFSTGQTVTVCVSGTVVGEPERFTTTISGGRFGPIREGGLARDASIDVSRDLLEAVAHDPDEYVRHPERLHWHWRDGDE